MKQNSDENWLHWYGLAGHTMAHKPAKGCIKFIGRGLVDAV